MKFKLAWKSTGSVSNTYSTLVRTNAENTNRRPAHQYVWDDWNREMCGTLAIRSKLFRVGNNIGIGRCITLFRKCSNWTTTLDESRSQNFKYSLCGTKHCFAPGKLLNIWMHCLFALCVGAWNLINIFKSNLGTCFCWDTFKSLKFHVEEFIADITVHELSLQRGNRNFV